MSAPETADGIRRLITDAESDVARLTSLADELAGQRRAALVEEDDRRLAAVERELLRAERDRERGRLKVEALNERLCAAERAEREVAKARKRAELADVARARLKAAARLDKAIAELDEAAQEWVRLGLEVNRRWVIDRCIDEYGALMPEFVDPAAPLCSAVPPRLALLLRMQPAAHPIHGPRPVVQTDPAARGLALLDGPPPPKPVHAPEEPVRIVHSSPGGVHRLPAGA